MQSTARATIYALSSGAGKAGVAVIRVSGPSARLVLDRMTQSQSSSPASHSSSSQSQSTAADQSSKIKPRYLTFRNIVHPATKELLDTGMVAWMAGPKSYTGEDVVELQVHGGRAVTRAILSALSQLSNVVKNEEFRMAEPGEFSMRAFYSGKMDLTALEGVADLIDAETEAQRRQALRQGSGALQRKYDGWRDEMINSLALVESIIDFGEDEQIEDGLLEQVTHQVKALQNNLKMHLNDNHKGEIIRQGIRMAVIGPPNAGKSSLLNMLSQRDVAIVSPIPGTTRDVVENTIDIGGYPVVVSDTAGIRSSEDVIEQEGVRRSQRWGRAAHVRLCVLDASDILDSAVITPSQIDSNLLELIDAENTFVVFNKHDLIQRNDGETDADLISRVRSRLPAEFNDKIGTDRFLIISCSSGHGFASALERLSSMFHDKFDSSADDVDHAIITQERHRGHLERCEQHLSRCLSIASIDVVMAAEELRMAAKELGLITGRIQVESVLGAIFSRFCIGK